MNRVKNYVVKNGKKFQNFFSAKFFKMSSPANLMNFPDAYGQYYHPTPTPQNAYGYNPTENVVKSMSSMPEHEYSNLDYYYQTSEVS